MGQRHNRRRTRPRSHQRNNLSQDSSGSTIIPTPSSPILVPSSIWSANIHSSVPASSITTAACISPGSLDLQPLAPTWHFGSTAWQIREGTLQREADGLESEQYRLFGGEPGDDVSLCYRMLEYFGGLDYIDS